MPLPRDGIARRRRRLEPAEHGATAAATHLAAHDQIDPVERPDFEGSLKIALALYRDILAQHDWGFPEEPGEAVLAKLADMPPRDMRKMLIDAFGNAKLARRDHLLVQDLNTERLNGKKARIGF